MTGSETLGVAEAARQRLLEVECRLARPESPDLLTEAVGDLEQACRQWPALMACVTDRAVWESLSRQIRRLEVLAGDGGGMLRVMEELRQSARGYTAGGEPAREAVRPASVDCRG